MQSLFQVLYFITASPKRLQVYMSNSESVDSTSRLQPFCATRWSQRVNCLQKFSQSFGQIVSTLDQLSSDQDNKTACSANSLLKAINDFNFIVALFVARQVFQYTSSLTLYLQNDNCDLVKAFEQASNVVSLLKSKRMDAEFFKSLFLEATQFSENHDIEIKMPRIVGRQITRANAPANSPEEYYRLNVFIPTIDYLISQLTDRLCTPMPRMKAQYLVPSRSEGLTDSIWQELKETYQEFLPSIETADSEYDLWKHSILNGSIDGSTLQEALKHSDIYPNIQVMLKVLLIMPVSTATVERSFSGLRRLKNYMRSSMTNGRLTGLALMHVHKNRNIDIDRVIKSFDASGHRRIVTLI